MMSRRQCPAGRPPRPCFHAGPGSVGSITAHSASLMSGGYHGTRVLRLIPPGQQRRHATAGIAPVIAHALVSRVLGYRA
jgi:hypothetical protein